MPKHVEIIARGVILHRRSVLLCQHARKKYFYLPGGHIEWGEAGQEALIREMQEEAGLRVAPNPLVAVEDHFFEQDGKKRHELNLIFFAFIADAEIKRHPERVRSLEKDIRFRWCPLRELKNTRLLPESHKGVVRYCARTPFSTLAAIDLYDWSLNGESQRLKAKIPWGLPRWFKYP